MNEDAQQVVGGNGGQRRSFASLCESCAAVPPLLTLGKKFYDNAKEAPYAERVLPS